MTDRFSGEETLARLTNTLLQIHGWYYCNRCRKREALDMTAHEIPEKWLDKCSWCSCVVGVNIHKVENLIPERTNAKEE